MNTKEIFKDIPEYEGIYQVSNLGRVKSLKRKIWNGRCYYNSKEKILKQTISSSCYLTVGLYKYKICITNNIHQLVAIVFLKHKLCGHKLVVNHKNFDKLDNRLENLEIITARENSNKKHIKSSSKYVGVFLRKRDKIWISQIYMNGKQKYLGSFYNELEASNAYQNALKQI